MAPPLTCWISRAKSAVSQGLSSSAAPASSRSFLVSSLLANVYLHYVFDLWVEVWRKKVASGEVIVVRYADDLVVGFQYRTDAERFLQEFRERLAKFGLELHADKTRLIEFGRFAARDRKYRGEGKPETLRSWVSLTSVGSSTAAELSSFGGVRRRSGWSRSLKPLRLSFNAGSIIARPRSVHGFGQLCWDTTNTTPFPETRSSCASLIVALADCGGAF